MTDDPWEAIEGYLEHYGLKRSYLAGATWEEVGEQVLALLRHMEDVLPAPAPQHPLYPERYSK